MKIEVNVTKTKLFILIASIFVLIGGIFVYAYTTTAPRNIPDPGHALSGVQGYFTNDASLETSLGKFCQSDGTNCPASTQNIVSRELTLGAVGSTTDYNLTQLMGFTPNLLLIETTEDVWSGSKIYSTLVVSPISFVKKPTGGSAFFNFTKDILSIENQPVGSGSAYTSIIKTIVTAYRV